MNRRTFLATTTGVALAALAAGCQPVVSGDLILALLTGSVPVQLVQAFQRQQAKAGKVGLMAKDSLLALYTLLQSWDKQAEEAKTEEATALRRTTVAHWVTQADYWLASAIQQGLIQPIDAQAVERWAQLPAVWPQLVTRNNQGAMDASGKIWGIPYRWTGLAILYDARRFKGTLQTWNDLLHPALTRQILLPDHPRLVLGLALKGLGASANHEDPAAVADFEDFVTQLHGQVKGYNSDHTLKSLIIGDATAVVGWLDAMLPVAKQYRNLRIAIPTEGTLVSADLWVKPKSAEAATPLATDWLNFCLADEFATQMAIYNQGLSPWLWGKSADQLPDGLEMQKALFESPTGLERSEFLMPLSSTAQTKYDELWQRMRT
ncbi:MAG: extracellular solute-binding protein [Leptolyngbyaceae cyanobacterium SM2_5_2]|nr:extracellular solute-binding protein [Leptolyngbyaceae cyanobacterium SM2_5_2]